MFARDGTTLFTRAAHLVRWMALLPAPMPALQEEIAGCRTFAVVSRTPAALARAQVSAFESCVALAQLWAWGILTELLAVATCN